MASKQTASEEGETITRTDVGASIEAVLKRGEGTRDEDRIKIKGKGKTAEDALEEFELLLDRYEEEHAERLRNIGPDRDSE